MTDEQRVDVEWCTSLPKIELHAHLNGSIRHSTLMELARDSSKESFTRFAEYEHIIRKSNPSLEESFKLFDLIHIVTTDHNVLTRITKEVVEDFAAENTIYLELRTTPKKQDAVGMTKRSYMEAVLDGLRTIDSVDVSFIPFEKKSLSFMNKKNVINGVCRDKKRKVYVRLLLCIDRRETTDDAMETVFLAIKLMKFGVVGVDLSGNPTVGDWQTFLSPLRFAKEHGLCITLHCGEVHNPAEIDAMLEFRPQRIGHACHLQGMQWKKLMSYMIPVEICLTSNIRTNAVPSYSDHHFGHLYRSSHPTVICTDDKGILSTSLSFEYYLAASTMGLQKQDLTRLARHAVDFVFADERVRSSLREVFSTVCPSFGARNP